MVFIITVVTGFIFASFMGVLADVLLPSLYKLFRETFYDDYNK